MAFYDSTWYANYGNGTSTGYYAVTVRPQNTAVAAGVLRRQFTAPAVGSERVFVCIVAGTTANVTDATWVLTRGAKTTDGTATWQECTGASAVNGDLTNTPTWTQAKAIGSPTLGAIIQRNNGASYWICSTAGTLGASEPAWANNTAGTTQADSTTTWTCLGVVGNFTGGQAPHARLANALATNWFASGNTVYVGDNHAETQTTTMNIATVSALMAKILCHNHSASYPPAASDLTTGATITSTNTGTASLVLNMQGSWYLYGIAFFASGSGASMNVNISNSSANFQSYDSCLFNSNSSFNFGPSGSSAWSTFAIIILNNCTVSTTSTGSSINMGYCLLTWQNTGQILAGGSAVPAVLFKGGTFSLGYISTILLEGLDLSQITGSLFQNTSQLSLGTFTVKDCKLNASTTVTTPANPGQIVQLIRCDSGATSYKSARYAFEGTETTETSITRVGGAVDPTGQAQTRKIVTTANAQWLRPFRAEPYAIWNPITGSNVTVTVDGTINAGALPTNDDIWLEIEYLGSSATPLGTIVTTTKASVIAANAAVASDGSTWNGGGSGAGWSPFKLVATLSSPQPGMAGYLYARVCAAKASTTYYLDPKIVLS